MEGHPIHPTLAGFVPFHRPLKGRRSRTDVRLTLTKDGKLTLNDATRDALDRPARVALYWDGASRVIALRACDDPAKSAAVSPCGKGQWQIAVRAFCTYYGLGVDRAQRLTVKIEDGILFAEAPPVATSAQKDERDG